MLIAIRRITVFLLVCMFFCNTTLFANDANVSILSKGDSISVWVVGEPELSVDALIAEDGTILMPLIGYVKISDMPMKSAKKLIEDSYRNGYLQKPLVHIAIRVQRKELTADEISILTDGVELETVEDTTELFVDPETECLKILKYAEIQVIDGNTRKGIHRAYIHLPRNKTRYTDRNGYVRIPSEMNLFNEKAIAKVTHKSYETSEMEVSFVEPQKIKRIRLYAEGDCRPTPLSDIEEVVQKAKSAINSDFLEAKVSFKFVNKDLKTILNAIGEEFDISVSVADDDKKLTLTAEDVTVRELLKNLLLRRNYQYTVNDSELVVVFPIGEEQKTVKEMLFRDISLQEALRILAGMMKINLFVTPRVEDRMVNFYVDYLNLNELFNLLLETNNLKKIKRAANTYIIDSADARH